MGPAVWFLIGVAIAAFVAVWINDKMNGSDR